MAQINNTTPSHHSISYFLVRINISRFFVEVAWSSVHKNVNTVAVFSLFPLCCSVVPQFIHTDFYSPALCCKRKKKRCSSLELTFPLCSALSHFAVTLPKIKNGKKMAEKMFLFHVVHPDTKKLPTFSNTFWYIFISFWEKMAQCNHVM